MNYILKHTGGEKPDFEKVTHVIQTHQGSILDDSVLPKMALIKVAPSQLKSLQEALPEWDIFPENTYEVPSTKKTIRRR